MILKHICIALVNIYGYQDEALFLFYLWLNQDRLTLSSANGCQVYRSLSPKQKEMSGGNTYVPKAQH